MKSKNVLILAVCQAFAMSVSPAVVLVSGIVGVYLAPRRELATLPISIMVVGLALSTIPAALLMRRIGRRSGFIMGASLSLLACLLAAYALSIESFILLCLAGLLIGANTAFIQQYRFAAAESVIPAMSSRAVSYVLIGGIFAGYLGPEIARLSRNWLGSAEFAASFIFLAVLLGLVILLMSFFRNPAIAQEQVTGIERPLAQVVSQPAYLVALAVGVVSYGVMSFIMTATPIEMHSMLGFSIDQTTWVIQSHIIAMYLPSLFTGLLIERIGVIRVVILGLACMVGCVILGVISQELLQFWGALVLLGIGWNFLYISGTVILTGAYFPKERFKAQAVNDFTIFAIQALTSLSSAAVIFRSNWDTLVLLNLPALMLVFALVLLFRKRLLPVRLRIAE